MTASDEALNSLRVQAIDHIRAHEWPQLVKLRPQLEQDAGYWVHLWGPACAVAAHHEGGRDDARALLEDLIAAGLHDVSEFTEMFADTFAAEPDWPALAVRINANTPAPPVELLGWPTAVPIVALELDRLDIEAESRLAARVPDPGVSALETALDMLSWVTSRWCHSGASHVAVRDANEVLDRVEGGERFACREYTIVLTQALNAVGIPARALSLLRDGYHAGLGTGHAATEAWIDDLGRWVVLDGQNGATWRDSAGELLGVVELQQWLGAGDLPSFVGDGPNFEPESGHEWLRYFAYCRSGGLAWRSGSFVPLMEGDTVVAAKALLKDPAQAHPELSEIATSIVDEGGPAARFSTAHPFATGFVVGGAADGHRGLALDESLALSGPPGDYELCVSTRTPYAALAPSALTYTLR
ncbi:MAG: transglutaminase-like domain-containing protein [Nocardioidaceae bacterium]